MIRLYLADPRLLRLAQWIMLDEDPARTDRLGAQVFRPFLEVVAALAGDLGGHADGHRLAVSLLGLVTFPFFADGVTRHLPGYRPTDGQVEAQVSHVVSLLRRGIGGGDGS